MAKKKEAEPDPNVMIVNVRHGGSYFVPAEEDVKNEPVETEEAKDR